MDLSDFSSLSTSDQVDPFTSDPVNQRQIYHHTIGLKRGTESGQLAGWRDGYQTGLKQGATISSELGYYEGFARSWISIMENNLIKCASHERKLSITKSLLDLCMTFPNRSSSIKQDDDVQGKLTKIRLKYRQACSMFSGVTSESRTTSISRFPGPSWNDSEPTLENSKPTDIYF